MSAAKALAAWNEKSLDGRTIWIEYSGGMKPRMGNENSGQPGEADTVFCGNLGFSTSEDALGQFFGQIGDVKAVRIAMGEDGRSRGFGHVEFYKPEDA